MGTSANICKADPSRRAQLMALAPEFRELRISRLLIGHRREHGVLQAEDTINRNSIYFVVTFPHTRYNKNDSTILDLDPTSWDVGADSIISWW